MESLFAMSEPPLGVRMMGNPPWPLLTDEARMEKLRTMLFHDLHGSEGAGASVDGHPNNTHGNNDNSGTINEPVNNGTVEVLNERHLGLMPPEQSEVVQLQPGEGDQRGNSSTCTTPSRYESQKRRDWNTFRLYLKNHRLDLQQCSGTHVLEFLRYLDQFGKTKVHLPSCNFFGVPTPPHPCRCPLRQAWGSLDALIGRLRAAFEEHGGKPESNPFGARMVRLYLREVREMQAKARGVAYGKKKRKCSPLRPAVSSSAPPHSHVGSAMNLGTAESQQNHQQQLLQQQPPMDPLPLHMRQALASHDQAAVAYGQAQKHHETSFQLTDYNASAPDPHSLNAFSPHNNTLMKPGGDMSNFRPPLSFHSFLDDLPGRRAEPAGWALGTVYGR